MLKGTKLNDELKVKMKKFIVCLIAGIVVGAYSTSVEATISSITASGEYTLSDSETIEIGRKHAQEYAVRSAAEQAGVFVKSYTEVKNNTVTNDEIQTLSAQILQIKEKRFEKRLTESGDIHVVAYITALVDTDKIDGLAEKLMNDQTIAKKYSDLQKEIERLQEENQKLKARISVSPSIEERKKLTESIIDNNQKFTAEQMLKDSFDSLQRGEYVDALRCAEEAAKITPNRPEPYANMVDAYINMKQYDKANEISQKIITLAPNDFVGYLSAGNVYTFKGDYKTAENYYKEALKINPNNLAAITNLGSCYYYTNREDSAIEMFNKAIKINPNVPAVYNSLGLSLFVKMRDLDALVCYDKAIALNPRYVNPYINKALLYIENKKYDKAIKCLEDAITLSPNTVQIYALYGDIYFKQGKYDEAIKMYKKLVELEPNNADYYMVLGEAYRANGNMSRSTEAFKKATELYKTIGAPKRQHSMSYGK